MIIRLIKTLVIVFMFPLPFCVLLLVIGLGISWFTTRQRLGKIILTSGVLLLLISSIPITTTFFIRALEDQYPALLDDELFSERTKGVQYIVVLGSGYQDNLSIPPTSRHDHAQMVRSIEGLRLHKKIPSSKLVLSGGSYYREKSSAESMAELLISLGEDKSDIILEPDSHSTYQSAKEIHKIVKDEPFILVTSAAHMPRAVAIFRKMGANPAPAPTDYMYDSKEHLIPIFLNPSGNYLYSFEITFYEFCALTKDFLAGRM